MVSCDSPKTSLEDTQAGVWPEITKEAKPWTRWWWMGSAVDQANLERLLEEYEAAGLGGVEIAPIYGAKGHEDRYLEYLSEDWLKMLEITVTKANALDMGVDLTQGTGWPFGGPQVSPEHAASRLLVREFSTEDFPITLSQLNIEDRRSKDLNPQLMAVMAYEKNEEKAIDITNEILADTNPEWEREGDWSIKAIYNGKTGQKVKRAAPGGEGYTLDHYSKEATDTYLSYFENAFGNNFPDIRSFYNDSFEVYGSDFTPLFFEEFAKRRGYELIAYFPELLDTVANEKSIRIKSDYRQTIHELLLENFTQNWTEWAHQNGKKTKNQAHGSPGNLLDLYAAVDIPEGETFGSSYFPIPGLRRDSADIRNVDPDPIMLKFASSAGHLSGNNLISCETFTWLGEHFKSSFAQAKPEVEQAFLGGINHVFYHGVTYSPEDVEFPGWLFYASLNLTPANSLWPHFKSLNDYIARTQAVLQYGKPDNEIWMYWPVYDVWADPKGLSKMMTVHAIDEWLHPSPFYKESKNLMDKGYSIDFVSDNLLQNTQVQNGNLLSNPNGGEGKIIIVPQHEYLPETTLASLLGLAEKGATVLFQEKPNKVPGFYRLEKRQKQLEELWSGLDFQSQQSGIQSAKRGQGEVLLTGNLSTGLIAKGLLPEKLTDSGLKFIRRTYPGGKFYYLVNHTDKAIDQEIPIDIPAASVVLMDPQSGETGMAKFSGSGESVMVRLQLLPGEAMIIQTNDQVRAKIENWKYLDEPQSTELDSPWELEFANGGPIKPKKLVMDKIAPWTATEEAAYQSFSGQAVYTTNFILSSKKESAEYVLEIPQVHESAKVLVNGEEAGYLWSIPYRLRIGKYLQEGDNKIKIEVANLMANRIRDMDQKEIPWRNYHEINFVNIDYRPFNASNWKTMPSGLAGPVLLHTYP